MSRNWYYKRGTQEIGPISSSELKAAAASRQLQPDDLVRADNTTKWIPASKVRGLFDHNPVVPLRSQPPPLPPKAKPGPPPLPPKVQRQPPPIPVVRPAVPLDTLLTRLTAYARAVPHHDIKDFGNEIEITGSAVLTVYQVELTTLFERREVAERERPCDGGAVPAAASVTLDSFDPWGVGLPPAEFTDGTVEVPVPDSESARPCTACGSDGELVCPSCDGERVARCPTCDGNGIARCGNCFGLGRVENKVPQQRQRACHCVRGSYQSNPNSNVRFSTCSNCGNTGVERYTHYASEWVQCLACQATGRRTCGGCRGHGRVACPTCGGHGGVGCEACGRSGRVIHSLAVVRTLDPYRTAALAPPDGCPDEAANLLGPDDDFESRFARTVVGTPLSVGDWSLPLNAAAVVEGLRTAAAARTSPEWRSVGERVRVLTAPVYRLDYTFGGRRYAAWLPGEGRSVYAPTSPLTERAAELMDDAETAWAKGDRRATLRSLRMALDMGKKCDQCQTAVGLRRSAIPDDVFGEAGKFDLLHWLGNLFR